MNYIDIGSVWRKWDLHVHAPTSVFANQFDGQNEQEKWEKYLLSLEGLTDISALGITDYWSIDGYRKVAEAKKAGRIQNVELILPNVELRLSSFTPAGRAVNFHCIFNPDFVYHLESRFFGRLSFTHNRIPYFCTKDGLIQLGRAFTGNSALEESAAYAEGCNQFKVTHETLMKLFNDDHELRKNVFLIVPNSNKDGNSGIQDDAYEATRQEIYRFVDAVFCGNPKSAIYFLGDGTDSTEEITRKYGRQKPCLHGSDAHSNETLCKPSLDRFTWIKSELTFEGLKQIIFEPRERVVIGSFKPDAKSTYQTIKSIAIQSTSFIDSEILLNKNLVTVIGGRSTGKSLFLYHIAKTADPSEVNSRFKDMERIPPYKDFQKQFDMTITWDDDSKSQLSNTNSEYQASHKVTYIPQSYLNHISDRQKTTVDEIIEKVLLQNDQTKSLFEKFKEDRQKEYTNLSNKIAQLFLENLKIRDLVEEARGVGNKEGIEKYIAQLQNEIKEISVKFGFTEEEITLKESLQTSLLSIQRELSDLTADESKLTALIKDFRSHIDFSNLDDVIDDLSDLSKNVASDIVRKAYSKFELDTKQEVETYLGTFTIKREGLLQKQQAANTALEPLTKKAAEQAGLEEKQKILVTEKAKLQKVETYYKQIEAARLSEKNVYNSLIQSYSTLHKLYKNHVEELKKKKDKLTDVELEIDVIYDAQSFEDSFYNAIIDKRSERLDNILPPYNTKEFEKHLEFVTSGINKILKKELPLKDKLSIEDSLRAYLDDYFKIDYRIKYHGDEFIKMSPGKRSLVLLKLLIELDDSSHPILLDQPEDDLDNRSIYFDLVTFIREKKKTRQIIIVTHNPNLVIGTDSEQVVVANQEGQDQSRKNKLKQFEYVSGAIERSFDDPDATGILYQMGIREHICQILEGGVEAFKKREQRYDLQ